MTRLDDEAVAQRRTLHSIETQTHDHIAGTYHRVLTRLNTDLDALTRQIETDRAAGIEFSPSRLFAQERYRRLITQLEGELLDFLAATNQPVQAAQQKAIETAYEHGQRLVTAALGPAPRAAVATVEAAFTRLPIESLTYLIGRASNGQPLGMLLSEIAGPSVQAVTDALAYGVAAGKNPRVIAREVRTAARIPLNRALTIARTEMLGAHRAASMDTYRASRVVTGWTWHAQLDTRTCAVCWAMHGTEHSPDETLDTHPNCRCAMVPRTPSWSQLGFTGIPDRRPTISHGADVFRGLPEADKLAILGRRKLDAYNQGRISLEDLVRPTFSPRWGAGKREASLREIGV